MPLHRVMPDRVTPAPIRSPRRAAATWDRARLRMTLTWSTTTCDVALAGRLDGESAVALTTAHDQLERAGADAVAIDLTALRYVDRSGAVALAELWARLRSIGVACRVQGLHPVFGESPLDLLLFLRESGPRAVAPPLAPVPR